MRRTGVAVVLLMLLLAVDAVLVTGAIRSTHVDTARFAKVDPDPADTANDPPSGTAADTASAGTSPTTTSSASNSPTRTLPAGRIIITGLTATRAWRAVTPSNTCRSGAEPATIGHSQDGGRTWTPVNVPMATVSGMAFVGRSMIATGLDASCQPVIYSMSSAATPLRVSAAPAWSIDPGSPTRLLAAGVPVAEQPCTTGVADFAANSATSAVVLCGNGSVKASADSGASWKRIVGPSRIAAIATGGADNTVYGAQHTACGITVQVVTATGSGSCVPHTKKWSDPIDLNIVGGTMWLGDSDTTITEQVASVG